MSATRTAQAYPETQNLAAALGVVILAIAVMFVLAFGVLSASKATVSTPTSGAAPALSDHGSISDPANVSGVPPRRSRTTARSPTPANVLVTSSKSFSRGNHLAAPVTPMARSTPSALARDPNAVPPGAAFLVCTGRPDRRGRPPHPTLPVVSPDRWTRVEFAKTVSWSLFDSHTDPAPKLMQSLPGPANCSTTLFVFGSMRLNGVPGMVIQTDPPPVATQPPVPGISTGIVATTVAETGSMRLTSPLSWPRTHTASLSAASKRGWVTTSIVRTTLPR